MTLPSIPRHSERKAQAVAILTIPVVMDVMFSAAELQRGDLLGLQHLVFAVPLIGLIVLAWRQPATAAEVLLLVSGPLAVGYLLGTDGASMSLGAKLATEIIFVLPPLLAGLLLLGAARAEGRIGLIGGLLRR